VPAFVSVFALRIRLLVGDGDPTGAEGDVESPLTRERAHDRRGKRRVSRRPAHFSIQPHVIRVLGPRLQPFDPHERVVMPIDPEGRLHRPKNRHLTSFVRLHPDGRLRLRDVAQQRTKDEIGHPLAVP